MDVRTVRREELAALVEDLWLPFAAEMADLDSYDELADDVRGDALTYRERRFDEEDAVTFVADVDGELIGYATGDLTATPPVFARGDEVNVEDVYVAPTHRREGVATALLDAVAEWARGRDADHLTLSVNAGNDDALAFYEREGFTVKRHKMVRPLR